jgi:hypothetical protein
MLRFQCLLSSVSQKSRKTDPLQVPQRGPLWRELPVSSTFGVPMETDANFQSPPSSLKIPGKWGPFQVPRMWRDIRGSFISRYWRAWRQRDRSKGALEGCDLYRRVSEFSQAEQLCSVIVIANRWSEGGDTSNWWYEHSWRLAALSHVMMSCVLHRRKMATIIQDNCNRTPIFKIPWWWLWPPLKHVAK